MNTQVIAIRRQSSEDSGSDESCDDDDKPRWLFVFWIIHAQRPYPAYSMYYTKRGVKYYSV